MRNRTIKSRAPRVLVLGGYGFIGRHIVEALEVLGAKVLIGTRKRPISPHERQVSLHRLIQYPARHAELLNNVDVVINAVGILRQRWRENYDDVHHRAISELAHACAKKRVRIIHVSAIGLNNQVRSRFLKSKLDGEHALVNSKADWFLVRPSLVDGAGGFGARWFERVSKWPIYFIPRNARGLMSPIRAQDLGCAVAKIAMLTDEPRPEASRIFQLGGEQVLSLVDYLNDLRQRQANGSLIKPARVIKVPSLLARLLSHVCDLLHITPFSFGHYELLKFDNVAHPNRLLELMAKPKNNNRAGLETLRLNWPIKQEKARA